MALAFLNVEGDDSKLEDDEIKLGEPDEAEAESLPLHVGKCAKRYRVTTRKLNRLDRKSDTIKWIGAAILLWLVITSQQFASVISFLH